MGSEPDQQRVLAATLQQSISHFAVVALARDFITVVTGSDTRNKSWFCGCQWPSMRYESTYLDHGIAYYHTNPGDCATGILVSP